MICCLIVSKIAPEHGCIFIAAKDLKRGFLPFESKIRPYRLFTVEKMLVLKSLGEINHAKAEEVRKALLKLFE